MGKQEYTFPPLSGEEGEYIVNLAKEKKKLAHSVIESVYELVPSEYHKNIRLLSQKEKIADKQYTLTPKHMEYGLHSYRGKTYMETFRPYVDVEGRIEQMIAVHKEHSASYELDITPEQIGDKWVMTCHFSGLNKNGQPFKTKERSIIGFGATHGVDATNPIENASTSAVGRALSHGGYGNIGSGLSSYEDIYIAISRQKALDKLKEDSSGSNGAKQTPTGADGNTGHAQDGKQSQGSDRSSQGSGHRPPSGNGNSSQHRSQGNSGRPVNNGNGHGQGQGNAGQEEKNRLREKNKLVNRLMVGTQNWAKGDLKAKVQNLIQATWDGKFNSLSLEQLQTLDQRLGVNQAS
ncbi:hypothetical protein [Cohnella soli]|uniref:Uncharacterized protein n=1 Tax=Cohnella soli TaxID=425005 RepID=A0ABW0HQ60_9BACL